MSKKKEARVTAIAFSEVSGFSSLMEKFMHNLSILVMGLSTF
jgi:hypothetical protein